MSQTRSQLSLVYGSPLNEEPGQTGIATIPGYFREMTQRFADREALVYRTDESVVRWTYAEVWDRAFEVARALIACGAGKDSRIGVLMTNRPECIAAMFGASLTGGVIVALNTFSTAPELEYLVQASGVSILMYERSIAGKDFGAMLGELEPQIATAKPGELRSTKFPFLRRLVSVEAGKTSQEGATESWDAFLKHGAATPPEIVEASAATTKPADTGVLFFSSGTTSQAKGILHSHRAVSVQWRRAVSLFHLKDAVRVWTANGLFWSGNFTLAIGHAFSSGGSLVLQSVFIPEEAIELMQKERVEYPIGSPHQWARIAAANNYANADFSGLAYVDYRYPIYQHPTVNMDWRLPIAYGCTETLAINCAEVDLPEGETPKNCYGVPLAGNILKIVDPETGAIVPRNQRGELAIKGATLMIGYLGKPPEECFDDEGFYRTGDGGYVDDDGRMFFEGRLTDIIKTGGANVSPIEIDAAIRAFPGVKVTQTVGVPHDTLGEMVVACIVPHAGATVEEEALRDFLKDRLASYKIPRRVLVLREDELAMTGSNKVKAGALRQMAAERLGAQKS